MGGQDMEDQDTLELARGPVDSVAEPTPPEQGNGGEVPPVETGGRRGSAGKTILVIVLAILLLIIVGAIFALAIFAGSAPDLDAPQTEPNLTGRVWQWYYFSDPTAGGRTVANPASYTVLFNADATVSIVADCNNGSGTYTAAGGSIDVNITALTAAACPADSLGTQFAALLNEVVVYSFVGSTLLLELPADSGGLQLSENPPATPQPTPPPQVDSSLVGPLWKWFATSDPAVGSALVPDPAAYSVSFAADGTLALQADCNSGSGIYTADGSNISIDVVQMTRAACPPGSLSDAFVQQLNEVVLYGFDGETLFMDRPADAGTMQFAENPPPTLDPALIGPVWKWFAYTDPAIGSSTVPNPDQYTVTFDDNGNVSVLADCNVGNGTYTANSGSISIQITQTTLAACGSGSMGDQFVDRLNQVAVYSFEGDALLLDMPFDSGTLQLAENPPGPPPNLVGPTWQWTTNSDPAAGTQVIPNPELYTVTFNEDGTLGVVADCNTGAGSYTTSGSLIAITVSNVTASDCGPDSLGQSFIARLNIGYEYYFQGSTLVINLRTDAGSIGFAPG
jgi:heat shock protein HslJ